MMPKLILYSLCILILTFSGLCIPVVAPTVLAASVEYVPLAPIDVRGSEFTSSTYNDKFSKCVAPTCFPRYLRTIYNVGIALAGFFVVFSIVRGGFTLLFTDSILGHSEGKAIILRALGGAVIVYGSYILMNQISPSLGRDLDLSLAFERVPKAETGRGLVAVSVPDTDQLIQESVDLRGEIGQLVDKKQQLEVDAADLKKAEGEANKLTDPDEKTRVLAGLAEDKKRLEQEQRMTAAQEVAKTAENRILNDMNAVLNLPTLRGQYAKRALFMATNGRQFANEIAQVEKVLNDGVLEQYVNGQLDRLQPLIAAATSPEEKQALEALGTKERALITKKQDVLKTAIKNECDTWRAGNIFVRTETPSACDRYK